MSQKCLPVLGDVLTSANKRQYFLKISAQTWYWLLKFLFVKKKREIVKLTASWEEKIKLKSVNWYTKFISPHDPPHLGNTRKSWNNRNKPILFLKHNLPWNSSFISHAQLYYSYLNRQQLDDRFVKAFHR